MSLASTPPGWPLSKSTCLAAKILRSQDSGPVLGRFVPGGRRCRVGGSRSIVGASGLQGVVEHSVYVDQVFAGCRIGTRLLAELVSRARQRGCWMVQSLIISGNEASRALHGRAEFREVGHRERIAQAARRDAAGQCLDTFLYELRL